MNGPALVMAAQALERVVARLRVSLARLATSAELRLRAVEAKHDPTRDEWIQTARRALEDGVLSADTHSGQGPEATLEHYLAQTA